MFHASRRRILNIILTIVLLCQASGAQASLQSTATRAPGAPDRPPAVSVLPPDARGHVAPSASDPAISSYLAAIDRARPALHRSAGEDFAAARALQDALATLGRALQPLATEVSGRGLEGLRAAEQALASVDARIRRNFDAAQSNSSSGPTAAWRRADMRSYYDQRSSALSDRLKRLDQAAATWRAASGTARAAAARQVARAAASALAYLRAVTPSDDQPSPVQPAGVSSQPGVDPTSSLPPPGDVGPASVVQSLPPSDADLAPTLDVQITPEIVNLAALLDNDPLKIYAYVHDNVAFEPYYGSLKGSTATLWTQAGNDHDIASLLLALLRAAGIPARYVRGVMTIPVADVQRWIGVTNPAAAYNALRGIPRNRILSGNTLVALQVEHVWAAAYVPGESGDSTWLPLDASYKPRTYQPGIVVPNSVAFDRAAYLSSVKTSLPQEVYSDQVLAFLRASKPGKALADVPYAGTIAPEGLAHLPASLPYAVDYTIGEYAEAPDYMRHKVTLTINDSLPNGVPIGQLTSATLATAQIATSRLTISYTPVSSAMQPVIKVDGATVANGGATPLGNYNQIQVGLIYPRYGLYNTITYYRLVGGHHAVALGLHQSGDRLTAERAARLLSATTAAAPPADLDATLGELLYLAGMRYFQRVHETTQALGGLARAVEIFDVSNALLSADVQVQYLFDRPFAVTPQNLVLDAKNLAFGFVSMDGNDARLDPIWRIYAMSSSSLEHELWEEVADEQSVSTIKALQYAAGQGIPLLTINQANQAQLLPTLNLPFQIEQLIAQEIADGYTVTVHRDTITYNQWVGVGWIIENPATGGFGYLISGTIQGGQTTCPTCTPKPGVGDKGQPRDECGSVGNPVTLSNGNMYHQFDDVFIPTRGPALRLTRTYNAQSTSNGPFGYGWTFSYAMRLVEDPATGNVTFVNDSGGEYLFAKAGAAYRAPPGIFLTLTKSAGGFRLRDRYGTSWEFSLTGQLAREVDRNGNAQTLAYTGDRLTSVADALGRALTFTYNGAGKITAVRDFTGRVWTYAYSGAGDLISSTTPSNAQTPAYTTAYEYYTQPALAHNLKAIVDPRGQRLSFVYYSNDKVFQTIEPEGKVTTFQYLPYRNETRVFTARGFAWSYRYDANGFITRVNRPDGNPLLRVWDAAGNLTSSTDGLGYATGMTYDARGNLLTATNALGFKTSLTYDPSFSQLTSLTNPRGFTTKFAIDPVNGNTLSMTDPLGKITSFGYDGFGNLTSVKDANGHTVTLSYNANNYLTGLRNARGNAWALGRDDLGRLISAADALGNTTAYSYDALGRLLTTTDGESNTWRFEYDGANNLTRQVDANGQATQYVYDGQSNLLSIADAQGNVTRFGYASTSCAGCGISTSNLTSLTDANGNTRRYEYDALDRLARESDALGRARVYTYDAQGNVTRYQDESGDVTQYAYDKLGRRVSSQYADGARETFSYDQNGNLLSAANAATTITYAYDARDQVTRAGSSALGKTIGYGYDAVGNRVSLTDPVGRAQRYAYDPNDNLAGLTDLNGVGTAFAYDQAERLNQIVPAAGQPGVRVNMAYDRASRLTRLINASANGATTFSDSSYLYDAVGNLTRATTTGQSAFGSLIGTATYGYDKINRLIGATLPGLAPQTFGYDRAGNRTQAGATASFHDETDRLVYGGAGGTTQYAYDEKGNLRAKIDGGQTTSYTWNAKNQLIRIDYPDGTRSSYSYDALGRRFARTLRSGASVRYLYDGLNILQEYDAGGGVQATYTHARGIDHPLSMTRGGKTYYYVYDRLGSAIGLTDGAGTLKASYAYDAWGNVVGGNAGGIANPYRYTGREYDAESGLYYYRARYYDAQAGRFISRDPIGVAGGLNEYGYVGGNPVNATDPSGQYFESAVDIAALALDAHFISQHNESTPLLQKIVDYAALAVDVVALALPVVPGVGAYLNASARLGNTGIKAVARIGSFGEKAHDLEPVWIGLERLAAEGKKFGDNIIHFGIHRDFGPHIGIAKGPHYWTHIDFWAQRSDRWTLKALQELWHNLNSNCR